MAQIPPIIKESDFEDVDSNNKEEILVRFAPLLQKFHLFINDLPCMQDLQRIRRLWKSRTSTNDAFGTIASNPQEVYSFNHGGRNEAQFNIGLGPNYFRVGLGFEFTLKKGGDPTIVGLAYACFRKVIESDLSGFSKFVDENSLEVEWWSERRNVLETVLTKNVINWIIRSDKDFNWVFVGRLLRKKEDKSILENPVQLKNIIETVFNSFKPIWQKTQEMAAKNK